MSKIIAISTGVPRYKYKQAEIFEFINHFNNIAEKDYKKIKLLFERSGIETRYSVLDSFDSTKEDSFFSATRIPDVEERMEIYLREATALSKNVIEDCLSNELETDKITHLITVSCTGLSAPGIDIALIKEVGLKPDIHRSAVNFMGCYAAVHALKQADYICNSDPEAKVLIICVELCSLHYQKQNDMETIAANLLFADGAAAALVCNDKYPQKGLRLNHFYSYVSIEGEKEMAWNLSAKGFLMTLSAYIPQLIEKGIKSLTEEVLVKFNISSKDILGWAIHPGGRKILEVIQKELSLESKDLEASYNVLKNYGNMSSPTILFVIKKCWEQLASTPNAKIFGAAFGPGLTMESFLLENKL